MNIQPVSDLRNHYYDVEKDPQENGSVSPANNGCSSIAVAGLEQFGYINGGLERELDAADKQAATTTLRYSHGEVFSSLRK